MGTPATGQVILVPFPFSDLSKTKLRSAVVLVEAGREDWILCQVTSNPYGDERAVTLAEKDFQSGSLRVTSYARPGKLFTANASLVAETIGLLKKAAIKKLIEGVSKCWSRVFRHGLPRDCMSREQGEGHEFLHEATQVKNIWVPTGE